MLKNLFSKFILFFIILICFINFINASQNVIDVSFKENIFESISYNPLTIANGTWFDSGEKQTQYNLYGFLIIKNNHPTDSVNDIELNISGYLNLNNIIKIGGREGYLTSNNDTMIIIIPELAAGQNTTFLYNINKTLFSPPLNFTSNYSKYRVLAGRPITVFDTVQNVMNSTLYSNNCIYDINITNYIGKINDLGSIYNFSFNTTSLNGLDSSNVSILANNETFSWNLWGGNCLYSSNKTNIFYDIITPINAPLSNVYQIMNSTISYSYDGLLSNLKLNKIKAITDLDINFNKQVLELLDNNNATWQVKSQVKSPSNITVNLTQVSLWVSQRNVNGTGFTNPSLLDNDTVSGAVLSQILTPNQLLNASLTPWSNSGSEWIFNYTYSMSPIVWMDVKSNILNDGIQLSNSTITYNNDSIYIKELYLVIGYWLEINKNITRLGDNNYSIFIEVSNLGTSQTPANQAVVVYNFLPNTFNLTSPFVYSSSTWYTTSETNTSLSDSTYNGTIYQFAIMETNVYNSSLDRWGGSSNANNTWSVQYNVTGNGEFAFEDLFLTGVDPLHINEFGGTQALNVENVYRVLSAKGEYLLIGLAGFLGTLIILA